MSDLRELVTKLAPNGVQFKSLAELCTVFNGYAFKSTLFNSEGIGLPIIRIRDVNTGFSDTFYSGEFDDRWVVENDDILIGMDGDFRASRWKHGRALLNQRVCRLQEFSDELLPGFIYYQIQEELNRIHSSISGSTVKHLSSRELERAQVPVPPLPVQREIVRVLDRFTELETELETELRTELEARHAQYAQYRDALLRFEDTDCEWLTLSEVAIEFGRGKSKHRPRNDEKLYGGRYPFIQTGDVRNSGHLITEYTQTYNEQGLAQSKLWPRGTICITIAANIAETGILDFDACFPDSVIGVVVDPEKTSHYYVEYLLQSLKSNLAAKGQGSAQANINLATFENERFPFPSLEEQERIVEILDQFDALVSDLSNELSAELNARRKQYEHHRDRLLTFKELTV
ncbi:restriction endonuclease subunit S [Mycobacterium sp. NPDC003449]